MNSRQLTFTIISFILTTSISNVSAVALSPVALSTDASTPETSTPDTLSQAKKLYLSLTGTNPSPVEVNLIAKKIAAGQSFEAAKDIIDSKNGIESNGNFYNVTVKNFATPWTNVDYTKMHPLTDLSATVIGWVRDEKQFNEMNNNYIPSYCFNWSDPHEVSGHKQSGDINNPNNFENHKQASNDYALRPLQKLSKEDINLVYKKYYQWIFENLHNLNLEYFERYAKQFTNK